MSDSSPTDYSMPRSCPPLSTGVCSNSCSLSQWCHLTISSAATLISFCLQSFPASVYSNAFHIRWPKCWSFSFSNSPSNEYSVLIFFRIDKFDLLAVQKSSPAPQFESINSVFSLMIQLKSIHDYWKDHNFDYTDAYQQWCLCSLIYYWDLSYLSFQEASLF